MADPVVWFEVLGQDADKLRAFYGTLFGWKLTGIDGMDYSMVDKAGDGIPGGIGKAPEGAGWVTFYVKVDDIGATLQQVTDAGGQVIQPETTLPDQNRVAVVSDPEGRAIGLFRAAA